MDITTNLGDFLPTLGRLVLDASDLTQAKRAAMRQSREWRTSRLVLPPSGHSQNLDLLEARPPWLAEETRVSAMTHSSVRKSLQEASLDPNSNSSARDQFTEAAIYIDMPSLKLGARRAIDNRSNPGDFYTAFRQPHVLDSIRQNLDGLDLIHFDQAVGDRDRRDARKDAVYLQLLSWMLYGRPRLVYSNMLNSSPKEAFLDLRQVFSARANKQLVFGGHVDFTQHASRHFRSSILIDAVTQTSGHIECCLRSRATRNWLAPIAMAAGATAFYLSFTLPPALQNRYYSGNFTTDGWRFAVELKKYVKTKPPAFYKTLIGYRYDPRQGAMPILPPSPNEMWYTVGTLFAFVTGVSFIATGGLAYYCVQSSISAEEKRHNLKIYRYI